MSNNVTDLRIQRVGRYTVPSADNADCTVCHDADYGDVLINGVCGKCLLAENERLREWQKSALVTLNNVTAIIDDGVFILKGGE